MDKNKHICESCKHYIRYYVKYKTRFREVGGNCHSKRSCKSSFLNIENIADCTHWEAGEEETLDEKTVKELLKDILKKLEGLNDILAFEK